jgi:hypothetical protein
MHTFASGPYRFHHNGGFDGDIVITLVDTEAGGEKVSRLTARVNSRVLLDALSAFRSGRGRPGIVEDLVILVPVILEDDSGDAAAALPITLEMPRSVVADFVADRFVRRRLETWLESADTEQLLTIHELAGVAATIGKFTDPFEVGI